MKHQVNWSKTLLEDFIEEGLLNEQEANLMRMRTKNKTIIEQSIELNVSPETINRMVVKLKMKYDELHHKFPNRFPERKRSKKENIPVLIDKTVSFPHRCLNCIYCDDEEMTAIELLKCQLECKVEN